MKLERRNYQTGFSLSGLVSECSPGEIQEAQLVHAVETNNFQPSHVGFFLFVDPCRFVIRAVRSRLNGSWRSK